MSTPAVVLPVPVHRRARLAVDDRGNGQAVAMTRVQRGWAGVRVDGPNALSLLAWALSLVPFVLVVAGSAPATWAAAFLGFMTAGLVLVASRAVLAESCPRMAVAVGLFALAGVAGAASAVWFAHAMGGIYAAPEWLALARGGIVATAWLWAGAVLVSAARTDRANRGTLLRQLARERAIAVLSASAVEDFRSRMVEETQAVVTEQLRKAAQVAADPAAAAVQLTTIVDEVVRPLSREVRREAVGESVLLEPVEPVADDLRVPLREYAACAGDLRVFAWPIAAALALTALLAPSAGRAGAMVILAVLFAVAVGAVRTRAGEVALELRAAVEASEWAAARLRQLAWSEQQHLSQVIHGDAQARMVSLALRLQLDEDTDVAGQLRQLDDEISAQLASKRAEEGWRPTLDRVRAVWSYGLELTIDIAPRAAAILDADPVAGHALVEVVREAITNSVRHARANTVRVRVHEVHGDILIEAHDDGRDSPRRGTPGFGSAMLDAVCLTWSLEQAPAGHVLTALIPAEAPHE